jgi:hypothetical protein
MLWILLALQLSIPVLLKPVFSPDDVPQYIAQGDIARDVYFRTTVRPDGTIQGCTVEVSSGDPALDAYTCALVVKRAAFHPAKSIDGSPAFGVIRLPATWASSNASAERAGSLADLELSVNKLPAGLHSPALLMLQVAADSAGRVTACEDVPGSPPSNHSPELVSLACSQLRSTYSADPAKDDAGKPVPSVQLMHVEFKVAK